MNIRTSLLATGAAIAFAGLASAQYDQHWAQASGTDGFFFDSAAFFHGVGAPPLGFPAWAGPGDSVRHCYGIDQTQGGTNQTGSYTNSAFRVFQGYAAINTIPGVDIGLVSVHSASVNSLSGDACYTPIVAQPGLTTNVGAFTPIGVIGGTVGQPAPAIFAIAFQWVTNVVGPNILGTDANGFPLLANVIFEVQGPANGGPQNNQYYLISTELAGTNPTRPGGVANGNALLGSALTGTDPVTSNSISYSRLTTNQGAQFAAWIGNPWSFGTAGDLEFKGDLAFATPQAWAANDGNEGTGGPDWRISTAPVSVINLRLLDIAGGATNVSAATSLSNPCIVFNRSYFLWSATPGNLMLQKPMSWDTTPVLFSLPPQPGSFILGPLLTSRQGAQTVPANFDTVTNLFLGFTGLSLGTPITDAADFGVDASTLGFDTLFQGAFDPVVHGVTSLSGGGVPLAAAPNTNLGGIQLGVAALGLQFDACAFSLSPTEVASSIHISLQ